MIVVKLKGGLGNQMFQYATGKAVAKRVGTRLGIDRGYYANYNKRSYKLDNFDIDGERVYKPDIANMSLSPVTQTLLDFEGRLVEGEDNLYLNGYWQSEEYFKDIERDIKSDFSLTQVLNPVERGFMYKILHHNSVGIHVRLGDYLTEESGSYIDFLGMDYYKKALKWLTKRVKGYTKFVFSDDIEYAKNNLGFGDVIFCDGSTRDFVEMIMFSKCDHQIIANSSFSWWGAWLSDKKGYTIAPSEWFSTAEAMNKDLRIIPSQWISL